jgi:hypothetical protein
MRIEKSFNVQIWVGLKETYNDEKIHTIDDVYKICDDFVNDIKDCVSVTETSFRYVDGFEKGVVVGYIQYPRFPRSFEEIEDRALELAKRLMTELNQYRVTVTTPRESFMLENENVKR